MLFNSVQYLLFFAVIVSVYYAMPHRHRWKLLLAGSYYFYMCWRPAYIILMIISTLIGYGCGIWIGNAAKQTQKKQGLVVGIVILLAFLFVFKYLNFFGWTVKWFLGYSAAACAAPILDVLLPVGISFYTFQKISYLVDVYRGIQKPEKRLGIFALYASFFPQLVAGPIERPAHLLPQFDREVVFESNRVADGLKWILWGMFKKVAIADNLAQFVSPVYDNPENFTGPSLVVATVFFAFQIYCDFSGYSDIAIGSAKVIGFDLVNNFNRPYFAVSVGEFWRRWHISLSSWFRDYLYIPLGGSRVGTVRHYMNLCIIFLVCGIWHGASWNFVVWGALHGGFMIAEKAFAGPYEKLKTWICLDRIPWFRKMLGISVTFAFVCFAWIFFRAQSISQAWYIVTHLFTGWNDVLFTHQYQSVFILGSPRFFFLAVILIAFMEMIHLLQGRKTVTELINGGPIWLRWPVYYILLVTILLLGNFSSQEFLYFQF